MSDDKCTERFKACNQRIRSVEDEVCAVTKPESGALALMHEKINKIAESRVKWIVFWSICGVLITMIFGSFLYTNNVSGDVRIVSDAQRLLVTKDDFKEFKKEILDEIRRARR